METVVQKGFLNQVKVLSVISKRDGTLVSFDSTKIKKAILSSGLATKEFGEEIAKNLTYKVLTLAQMTIKSEIPTVEELQDLVEEVLLTSPFKKSAKAYILYRDQHSKIREMVKRNNVELIDNYLNNSDWKVKENSNMGYSLQGLNNYIASEISKSYWLNKIYSPEIRESHLSGDLHIHDLNQLSVYCVGWDLKDLLISGFKGVSGKTESLPAKHFRTALGQIVNFFYTLQGEAAGAQAFSNFDTLLAPFIRHDNLTYKQVKQALQEFVFNVNVPTRVGFQTPFTNVTLDLEPPSTLKDEGVIIGGQVQKENYSDFQKEMSIFNQAFLEVLTEGDAKGRVFTFPIPTFNITKDFNWDNKDLDPLWEVTSKYGIPYFANFINSDMSPDDARSMCCRLRLDIRSLEKRGGGLFGANPLTGSIGVVTINLPRIGLNSDSPKDFLNQLTDLMEIAKHSLEVKRKVLEEFTEKNLYPYTSYYLRDIKHRHKEYWKNHFSTIGIIGMNEACQHLFGEDIGSERGQCFSKQVLDYMRHILTSYQEETGNNYNLEATPAEGTSFRLAKLDQEKYQDQPMFFNLQNDQTVPFYTNSTQLPVNYSDDIFEVMDKQDDLQSKYTGGTVMHVFLGEKVSDSNSIKNFVKKICTNYKMPYFTISPSFSICPEHGYIKGEVSTCPQCACKTEIYSRVVGYLRPTDQWNVGKQAEFNIRQRYKINPAMLN